MGGTTAVYKLPYPTGTDRVADGDNAIRALADRSELVFFDSGWQALTLFAASSWNVIAGYGPPGVRRVGQQVYMRGLISKATATAAGQRIVDPLPVGFRPGSSERYPVLCYVSATAFMGTIQVDTNGVVTVDTAAFTASVQALSLTATWLTPAPPA